MKRIIKRAIAILLALTAILLVSCSLDLTPVKAAEISSDVDLDGYGAYISNDELGEIVSYGGYISKSEYASMLNDNSVGASYNPSFAGCYDTNGYQIYVRRAMAGQYVGEAALMIYVNSSRAYCIQPGAALNSGSSLTQTTSSGVWASLSVNQQQAINTALCYGREGNFSNIKGNTNINSDQCYIATQLIIWEIVNGERSATAPFSLTENGYLSMYCADGYNGNIAEAYHRIENAMASAQTVPSFASKSSSNAPLYTLKATYNSVKRTWSYSPLTLTDSNSVMSQFAGFNDKTLDVGNATVTVKVNGNKVTLTPSAAKLNATSKTVTLNSSKSGIPTTNEARLIAYASSYQDVVCGGSVSAPTAYFSVRVTVSQTAKLESDFHVRKVIGTQNEYDTCEDDVIEGVASTSENLKGWYFRVEVSNVSTFYRYYNVRSFVLGPTDEAGLTQTVGEYVMEHFDYSNVSELVPSDYYEVTELGRKVGSGYVMPDFYEPEATTRSFLFKPTSNNTGTTIYDCYYTNIFSIPLEIIKTTDDGSSPENYYFTITNQETGKTYTAHVNSNGTFCPKNQDRASNGRTYLTLPEGKYTLTELGLKQTGGGYAIPERFAEPLSIEFEISADSYKQALESGYQAVTVKVDNKCEGKIKLRKTEEGGEQPVAGATYGLFSDEQCLNLIYQFPQTDSNGEAVTAEKYPCGEQYYIKEIESPSGFELSKTVYPVTVEAKQENEIIYELSVTDKKLPTRIQIIKVDEKGNPMSGVQLQIRDSSGNVVVPTWTTDGKPYEITGKLIAGQKYKLHEVKTLYSYNLANDVSFTVKDTPDVQTVRMVNRKKTGQVEIKKLDSDGKPLVGAQWKIYTATDTEVRFYRISEGMYTYTESGTVTTLSTVNTTLTAMNLPLGDYYLLETSAPSGKMANGKKIPFTISPDSAATLNRTITVKDNNIVMPNMGSTGKVFCYGSGIISFIAALAVFTYYKKKKTINHHAPNKGVFQFKEEFFIMKKYLVKLTSVIFIILTIIITAIPFASAATLLDETKKVSVTMNCSKPGYTFELFRVADLTTTSGTTNETAYTPLFDSIASEVKAGNSKNLLAKLDTLSPINTAMPTGAVSCGTFQTTASSTTKTFSSLNQGIYYVKCTKYPAGVKSVTNSVFALPYYQNNSWVYTLSAINLANKVVDGTPQTDKEITNSTKNNKNFTDVSVGDTVEFALNNTVTGSATNKLTQYTVKDKMSKGLTFNKDSVKVYLADSSKTKIADLTKDTDYKLNVTAEGTGKDTEFNIALTSTYLAKDDFYASNVSYVIVTYSAVLNDYAVKGTAGNPNEDVELTYGNNSSVASVPGNTVYVYTYGVNVMKNNENGSALQGAKFSIFKTNANAENKQNALGTGTSDSNGKVTFLNAQGKELKLASGTYYIAEIEAPSGYNVYGKVIPVTISATYRTAISNGTWVQNAPSNGTASVTVTDTKLIVPQTGGYVMYLYIAGAASLVLGGAMLLIIKRNKKNGK